METAAKKLYEGMFLVDSALAAADWDGISGLIKGLLEKADAEIVSMRKWDERKLAYEVQGKGRGTYILCYFRAGGDRISSIERGVQLSEKIMRVLILCVEHLTQEDLDKATPAMRAKEPTPVSIAAEKKSKSEATLKADSKQAELDAVAEPEGQKQEVGAKPEEAQADMSEEKEPQAEVVSETQGAHAEAEEAQADLSGEKEQEAGAVAEPEDQKQEAGAKTEEAEKDLSEEKEQKAEAVSEKQEAGEEPEQQ